MHPAAYALLVLAQVTALVPSVTFFTNSELQQRIKSAPEETPGQPGLYSVRLSADSDQPVIGIRRTQPGRSELHAHFADVWYVLQGEATLVTGGQILDGKEVGPGEIRGRSIAEGNSRELRAGDYAVIPPGVPHWISRVVSKEFMYIVVKVPDVKESRPAPR